MENLCSIVRLRGLEMASMVEENCHLSALYWSCDVGIVMSGKWQKQEGFRTTEYYNLVNAGPTTPVKGPIKSRGPRGPTVHVASYATGKQCKDWVHVSYLSFVFLTWPVFICHSY